MQLSDVWAKIATQKRLTEQEKVFLKQAGDETQRRNAFVGGNIDPAGNLIVESPFANIYSEVLTSNQASVGIEIPSIYNHLFIFASGRSDAAAVDTDLCLRINRDTGANYSIQNITGTATTVTAAADDAATYGIIGGLAGASAAAGKAEGSTSFLLNSQSAFYKTLVTLHGGLSTDSAYLVSEKGTIWKNTARVNHLTFLSSSGNILAGSIISVYGVI